MTNTEIYLKELLNRLNDDSLRAGETLPEGTEFSSKLTVSWQAREEVRGLNDPKLIEPLKILLQSETDLETKKDIYWVLILLAEKCQENIMADFILNDLKTEKVRCLKAFTLESLARSQLPIFKEVEYVFELTEHKDWQISSPSISLFEKLDKSYSERIEVQTLNLIDRHWKKPHQLGVLCDVLRIHGSKVCIKKLKEIIDFHSRNFVIISAIYAIATIDGSKQLQYLHELYQTKRNPEVKQNISKLLCQYGYKNEIDILIVRVKKVLSKVRETEVYYSSGTEPEIVTILKFLIKFDDERVVKLIHFIASKKVNYLDETEQQWFKDNINC